MWDRAKTPSFLVVAKENKELEYTGNFYFEKSKPTTSSSTVLQVETKDLSLVFIASLGVLRTKKFKIIHCDQKFIIKMSAREHCALHYF